MSELQENPRRWIEQQLDAFVRESPANHPPEMDGGPIFDAPLVGVADGDDPLFANTSR